MLEIHREILQDHIKEEKDKERETDIMLLIDSASKSVHVSLNCHFSTIPSGYFLSFFLKILSTGILFFKLMEVKRVLGGIIRENFVQSSNLPLRRSRELSDGL